MDQITDAVAALFTGLFDVIIAILLPTTGLTPVSTLAWFGLVVPALVFTLGFLRNLAKARGN
jgi:uncharacterized membrane protein